MATDLGIAQEEETALEEELIVQEEEKVLEEDMKALGEAVQEEEEVQGDTVDLDHNYFIYLLNSNLGSPSSQSSKISSCA